MNCEKKHRWIGFVGGEIIYDDAPCLCGEVKWKNRNKFLIILKQKIKYFYNNSLYKIYFFLKLK